ncbi:periodic tryptophan protein 1 homolog [Trichonephila clavata]|uniref:Periodic tryptophan protein 1 homolog n=1 Tax=Trichonephila clavata TaxID=2740835 RepID=A0A8X6F1W0_TRICU|nr:periodic tryptophan protein 1 homolog [Trichonephila clavata]
MNFIPCVAWIPKGIAKRCPEKLQLTPEELKKLIQETQEINGEDDQLEDDSEDETHSNASDDDNNSSSKAKDASKVDDEDSNSSKAKNDSEVDDDDFEARYNLDAYDDEEYKPFMNIADVVVHVDNKDDELITGEDKSGSEEENDDFLIKDNDNLLVVGHVEENTSVMEVYVYNKDGDALYVHHDIDLPSFPLALEWLDFNPSDDTPGKDIFLLFSQ